MYVLGSCTLGLDDHVGIRDLAATPAMIRYASEDPCHFVGQQTAETGFSGEALQGPAFGLLLPRPKRSSCSETAGRVERSYARVLDKCKVLMWLCNKVCIYIPVRMPF